MIVRDPVDKARRLAVRFHDAQQMDASVRPYQQDGVTRTQ